jgi:hypothetical protein
MTIDNSSVTWTVPVKTKHIQPTAKRCATLDKSTSHHRGVSHFSRFSDFIFRLVITLCFFSPSFTATLGQTRKHKWEEDKSYRIPHDHCQIHNITKHISCTKQRLISTCVARYSITSLWIRNKEHWTHSRYMNNEYCMSPTTKNK